MLQQLLTVLIGVLGGISVGLQTPIANAIGQRIGSAGGSFIVHISGAIISGILLLARGGENMQDVRQLPWWIFGVGVFGVILFLTINHTIPRIGTAAAITLIIVGQLVTGMLLDHFGLLGVAVRAIDGQRMIAAVLLLIGGYLMIR